MPQASGGDISSAEELYRQAVQADPNIHVAWRNLGALLRQQGKDSGGPKVPQKMPSD